MSNRQWVGSELPYAIDIKCNGFDMETDDWQVTITNSSNNNSVVYDKEHNTYYDDEKDEYILLVDTEDLGKGSCDMCVEIDVPDERFEAEGTEDQGYRHEVWRKEKFMIIK